MKYIDINLASDPVRNQSLYHWTYGILTGVVVLFLSYNLYAFFRYGGELSARKERLREVRVELGAIQDQDDRQRREVDSWDFGHLSEQAVFAGDTILRRTFSWTQLFNQLETVVPPQVMMVAIRPNITTSGITIRVDGIAKGHMSFLEFVENLQDSPFFRHVYPGGERREENKRIFFNLTFDYHPAAPEPPAGEVQLADADGTADAVGAGGPASPPIPEIEPETGNETGDEAVPVPEPEPAGSEPDSEAAPPPAEDSAGPRGLPARDLPEVSPSQDEPADRDLPMAVGEGKDLGKANDRLARLKKLANSVREGEDLATLLQSQKEQRELPPVSFRLFLQGETVSEAYRRLARIGKVTIVLGEGVNPGKRITARIRADSFEEALEKVTDLAGHAYWREAEGIYRIGDRNDPGFPPAPEPIGEEDLETGASREGDR